MLKLFISTESACVTDGYTAKAHVMTIYSVVIKEFDDKGLVSHDIYSAHAHDLAELGNLIKMYRLLGASE